MPARHFFAVDRIEGQIARLVDDEERRIAVPVVRLPRGVTAGDVLSIPLDDAGTPAWSAARIDADEAKRRLGEAKRLLKEMKERGDPGGNVEV